MGEDSKTGDSRPPLPLRLIAWIGTSVGITGLLIAVGYVVYSAHAEFLGFSSYTLAPADYIRVTGAFLLDAALQLSDFVAGLWARAARSWLELMAIVAGIGVLVVTPGFAMRRLRRLYPRVLSWPGSLLGSRSLPVLVVLLATVLSVAKSATLDVPASQVDGVLLRTAECNRDWGLSEKAQDRTNGLWRDVLCSREGAGDLLPACECGSREAHQGALRDAFLFVASWPVLLILPLAVVIRNIRASRASADPGSARGWIPLTLMILLVCWNVISVPYFYGKVLYPTTFSIGDVGLKADPDMPGPKGYILSSDTEAVTIFDCVEMALITLPRAEIVEIRVDDLGDVVLSRMGGSGMGACS